MAMKTMKPLIYWSEKQ